MNSRVLTIHLIEGTANGLQTAEIDNWIGKVFVAPRTDLPTTVKQQEIKDALGVYVLIGDDPNQFGKNIIYVGQGNITSRLTIHSKDVDKDYWDNKTLVVVAKDGSLNTADCLYLESRLIDLAKNSGVADVRNQTNPAPPFLAAPDKTQVENFLAQIQTLLPVLNIHFFTLPPVLPQPASPPVTPVINPQPVSPVGRHNATSPLPPSTTQPIQFTLMVAGIHADADLVDNLFIVRQGSQASPTEGALGNGYRTLRQQHRGNSALIDDPISGNWLFNQDVPFTSASAAAAVICGYNVNGPRTWKVKGTGQTYDAWQQAQLAAVSA